MISIKKDRFALVESENLFERFTGRLVGRKIRSEYLIYRDDEESLYLRINCLASIEKGGGLSVLVKTECKPLGVVENIVISTKDEFGLKSSEYIALNSFFLKALDCGLEKTKDAIKQYQNNR